MWLFDPRFDHSSYSKNNAANPTNCNQFTNGCKAKFWTASWIGGTSPALLFPNLYKHNKRKNRTVAEAMLHNDQWVRDILRDLTVGLLTEYVQLWGLVEGANFNNNPNNTEEDTIIWTRTASGEYTARSADNMQFEGGGMSSLFPKTEQFGVSGFHLAASSFCGYSFKIESGQQIAFSCGNVLPKPGKCTSSLCCLSRIKKDFGQPSALTWALLVCSASNKLDNNKPLDGLVPWFGCRVHPTLI